jgi:hypothetical protein
MAATAIKRWDKILDEVERMRRAFVVPLEIVKPGYARFDQASRMIVDALTQTFSDAWQTDRPAEDSGLYAVLEPVAVAVEDFDLTQPAAPQVDRYMAVVAEARSNLTPGALTARDIVADIEKLLKVTVLLARTGLRGAIEIADKERGERGRAINNAQSRAARFIDLHTMQWVERPSKTTLSLAVFLAMVQPPIATPGEWLKSMPDEADQPEVMKPFAAQWVVHLYTEWEEYYRDALAEALGCDREAIQSDYFADLKRMRQDYVHKMRGIARNSAKNKVLKWYRQGDNMIPTHANYLQLLTEFPAEDLLTPKPIPPAQRKPINANANPDLVRQFEETADRLGLNNKDQALDQMLTEWVAANR